MPDTAVGVVSAIIFVSALLILIPVPLPKWVHLEVRPSETEWRLARAVFLAFVIAFLSGIMVALALGLFSNVE